MGLIVYVCRNTLGECSRNGISARYNQFLVVNVPGPFNPRDDMPTVLLQNHYRGYLRLVPAVKDAHGRWVPQHGVMFGGNFAYSSDSRFCEACEALLGHQYSGAVAVHDRIE